MKTRFLLAGAALAFAGMDSSHAYIRYYLATDASGNFIPDGSTPAGSGTTNGSFAGSSTGFATNVDISNNGAISGQIPWTQGWSSFTTTAERDNLYGINTSTFGFTLLDTTGAEGGTADSDITFHVGATVDGFRGFEIKNLSTGVNKIIYNMVSSTPIAARGTLSGLGTNGIPWLTAVQSLDRVASDGTMISFSLTGLSDAAYSTTATGGPISYTPTTLNTSDLVISPGLTDSGGSITGTMNSTTRYAINGYGPGDGTVPRSEGVQDTTLQDIERWHATGMEITLMAPDNADGSPGEFDPDVNFFFSIDGGAYTNNPIPIPEPTTTLGLLLGLASFAFRRRRK